MSPWSFRVKVQGQRRHTITFVWQLPVAQQESRLWSRPKKRGSLTDTENLLFAGSKLLSHPLTPEIFYHHLSVASGSFGGTAFNHRQVQALTPPPPVLVMVAQAATITSTGCHQMSMSHQRAVLGTDADVRVLNSRSYEDIFYFLVSPSSAWVKDRSPSSEIFCRKTEIIFEKESERVPVSKVVQHYQKPLKYHKKCPHEDSRLMK